MPFIMMWYSVSVIIILLRIYVLLQILWLLFGKVRHGNKRLNFLFGVGSGITFHNYPAPLYVGLFTASVSGGITVSGFAEQFRSNNNSYFPCVYCLAVLSCLSLYTNRKLLAVTPGRRFAKVSFLPLKICRNDEIMKQLTVVCVIVLDLHNMPLLKQSVLFLCWLIYFAI